MEGNANNEAILLFFIVAFSGVLSFNTARDINMLEYPEPIKMTIFGKKLELQWKYHVNKSANSNWKISLYDYNYNTGTKTKFLALLQSGIIISNPDYLPLGLQKFNAKISYNKAEISILNTTFDDSTTGYGIIIQANNGKEYLEKFTEINIVEVSSFEVPTQSIGSASCIQPCHFFLLFMVICFFFI